LERPDVEAILRPLKPFQRRTVEHAFHRLFLAPDSTSRFLVADEVGLGKTLVARGIIGRAIEHMWDDVGRIDIVYICSNQGIAHANLPKLQISGEEERSFALATRLTMLATELAPREGRPGLAESKVNFVSFTPGTSFKMGHSGGKAIERRVLFHLLEPLVGNRTGLMNLCQGGVSRTDQWRHNLHNDPFPLEPNIEKRFHRAFESDRRLRTEVEEVIDTWFRKQRKHHPPELRASQNRVLGKLRRMLADICVEGLEPDLVILDEFQRFKYLLDANPEVPDPANEIAQALFHARTPEGNPVRTLLLSATPYKLYTSDAEIEHEDHYQDFLATTRFLMGEREERVQALKAQLGRFGRALKQAAQGHESDVMAAKREVEHTLRSVMARTERVAASADRDAMVEEPLVPVKIMPADIGQYLAADALFKAVGDRDPMPFWKSAPYLPHFMQGYKVNERLVETLGISPDKVTSVLEAHPDAFLRREDIEGWSEIDPDNAKLRELVGDLLDTGLWKLLWIPPTVPYWPLSGAFQGQEERTKTLLFSAWNVVPDVVSGVLSYEAERRMMAAGMSSYLDLDRQQRPLLRFAQSSDGSLTRRRLLLLLLPCLALADRAHPLAAPAGVDRREWVRGRVEQLLADPALPDPQDGPVDERWDVAALLLLDPHMRAFLEAWRDAGADEVPKPNPEVLPYYIDDLLALDPATLGRRPDGLADLLTEVALGAPGILAARTIAVSGVSNDDRRLLAARLAYAFWRLFNRPAVIRLLNQLHEASEVQDREDSFYWRQVLRYCMDGNLQSVLDECWHLVWEQHAWSERESVEAICGRCVNDIEESVEPRPSRVHAHFYETNEAGGVDIPEVRLRTVFALRFGHSRTEEGMLSQEIVRATFNSPFRPFVLASTSIGQEGLDFHPWCHRLVHWNLPGNPVDLEQREGRVHRYKGHAVRKNVAGIFAKTAMSGWRAGDDLWAGIFDLANADARAKGEDDLVPFWIAPGDARVQRRVPMLPYSSEVEGFRRLKRQLAAYRVVFGQPRQEELLTLLENTDLDAETLSRWSIQLSPPTERSKDGTSRVRDGSDHSV
jgi:hypothetical protein